MVFKAPKKLNYYTVYSDLEKKDVLKISKDAVQYAKENAGDTLIIDTAGRLAIDDGMMN